MNAARVTLAAQLDAVETDLRLMERPYAAAAAWRAQRDEWARRCSMALSIADEMPCTCDTLQAWLAPVGCWRHELETALLGDI